MSADHRTPPAVLRHLLLFTLLMLALGLLAPLPARAASPTIAVIGATTTLRPNDSLPPATSVAQLSAARNEFESFQIVVQAGDSPIAGFRVQAGDLIGPGGAVLSARNFTLYREAYYNVTTPSRNGPTGLWPDALIPDVDPFYGEQRNAFVNYTVPANERVVVWVDLLVPATTLPGRYTGALALSGSGLPANAAVTVELAVRNFVLPSTSTLESAFFTQYVRFSSICSAHTGSANCGGDVAQQWQLYTLYARAALEHRVTISNPWPLDPSVAPLNAATQAAFDRYTLPLINGASPQHPANLWTPLRLDDAQLTSLHLVSEYCLEACIAGWKQFAEQRGFGEKMFAYGCDEPGVQHWHARNCAVNSDRARSSWPGLPVMVTTALQTAQQYGDPSKIDIIVPLVNTMHGKVAFQGAPAGNQRAQYDNFLSNDPVPPANRLWLYTTCMSYGCNDVVPGQHTDLHSGWPGYAIDAAASEARALGWLAFTYRVSGELYYQTTLQLDRAWASNLYEDGANGDGTLFYPGTPALIGGTHDIPIESIRLKRIRDGREDYEYLHLLQTKGPEHEAFARAIADALFPAIYAADVAQQRLDAAREQLAVRIESLSVAPSTPVGQIVFSSTRDDAQGDLYIADANGSNLRRLTTSSGEDAQPALSQDGRHIAFTSTRDDPAGDIYVMQVDGGDVRRLTTSTGRDEKPVWSPDRAQIAWVSTRTGNMDIFVMDAATGANQRNLTADSPANEFDPTWSPLELGEMVFASTRHAAEDCGGGRTCGSELYRSGGAVRLTRSPGDDDNPSWSRTDWDFLVFNSYRDGNYELYALEPSGGANLRKLTHSPSTQDYKPVLSPDDRFIAFTHVEGGNAEIYLLERATGTMQNLTQHGAQDDAADWTTTDSVMTRIYLPLLRTNP